MVVNAWGQSYNTSCNQAHISAIVVSQLSNYNTIVTIVTMVTMVTMVTAKQRSGMFVLIACTCRSGDSKVDIVLCPNPTQLTQGEDSGVENPNAWANFIKCEANIEIAEC